MKKLIVVLLALMLAFSLVACGNKENGAPDSSGAAVTDPAAPGGNDTAIESLVDWMQGGTFSYDFTQISEYEGERSESTGTMAMAGENYAIITETVSNGVTSKAHIVVIDNTTYIIDEASRMVMQMSGGGMDLTGGLPTDYVDMALLGSGEGEVNGRVLPYDEYSVEGMSVKYYMDGGQVYAIESTGQGVYSLMIISNASKTVPDGIFDIPQDYTLIAL